MTIPPPHLTSLPQTEQACQILAEMGEFLGADSLDGFVLSYGTMVSLAPGLTATLLNGLLTARVAAGDDFSKADAKEVMDECREVYASRQQQGGRAAAKAADAAPGAKPASAREAALYAAVAALRKPVATE